MHVKKLKRKYITLKETKLQYETYI